MEALRAQKHHHECLEVIDHDGRSASGPPAPSAALTRRDLLRRSALGVAGLGLIGLVTGCGSGDGGDDEAPVTGLIEVAVRDNDFEPAAIEVPVGTTVTWRWDGDNAHNVVGDDFESETQTSGTFAHAFAAPGRYDYRCTLHGGMRGEVVVAERPSS